jgi:cytoskeletal protein RodZ
MNDSQTRPRRSLTVVVLDAALRLVAAVQAGATPTPKIREAGDRRGTGRYLLVLAVVAALSGTALLVVVLLRTTGGPATPPDRAAALPDLSSRPVAPSVARSVVPAPVQTTTTATPTSTTAPTAVTTSPAPSPGNEKPPTRKTPAAESAQPALTASYRLSSITVGLLGYRMTTTVANPGEAVQEGWTVTVTLPRSTLRVAGVKGATAVQDGSVWTFTPDATTARVPADGSIELAFEVRGATLIDGTPRECRIDGNPCDS